MRNKYMIVIDLDGTLLPCNKKIPFLTKRYINKLKKRNYLIVLASGRPARNVLKYHNDLKLNTPIIALNGLHIHYPFDNNKDNRIFFSKDKIRTIVKNIESNFKIKNIIFETDKEIYITNKNAYLDPNFWLTNMVVVYGTIDENLKHDVMTFLVELEDKNFDQEKLLSLFNNIDCNARCWIDDYQGFVEIFDENSNKARAIKYIAKEMDVDINNVIVFGDDLNDIEMLRDIPNSYAMKNTRKEVIKYAKHITHYDCEHEGVKKELKLILKNLK